MFRADSPETAYVLAGEEAEFAEAAAKAVAPGAFTIVQASHRSSLTERADVVLPSSIWTERSGTITNLEGRVLDLRRVAVAAPSTMPDWEILAELGARLGLGPAQGLECLTALARTELAR